MKREESFGVVPLQKREGVWHVFLIQHRLGRYWGFPKGHAEGTESAEEAAFRELKEETNLELVRCLSGEPFVEEYRFLKNGKQIEKRVLYFAAEVMGEPKLQEAEIQAGIWVTFREAREKMTHREGKDILSRVEKLLE